MLLHFTHNTDTFLPVLVTLKLQQSELCVPASFILYAAHLNLFEDFSQPALDLDTFHKTVIARTLSPCNFLHSSYLSFSLHQIFSVKTLAPNINQRWTWIFLYNLNLLAAPTTSAALWKL